MKRLLPLALLLVACGPGGQSEGHQPDSGATGKPVEATNVVAAPPSVALKGNPNRTHQLDTLTKVEMDLKGHMVHLWVMDDESKQQEGMMFLTDKEVKADEGMIFAFSEVQPKTYPDGKPRGFWMHNTLIPLDIVFLSPSGQVLNVGNGKVQDDDTVASGGDFQTVIELKAGTAAKYGLKPGDRLTVPKT